MDGFSVNAGSFPAYFGDLLLGSARPGAVVLDRLVVRLLEEEAHAQEGHWPCRGCGVLLSSNDDTFEPCGVCRRKRGAPAQSVALGGYDGGLGVLIAAAKYGRWALPLEILGVGWVWNSSCNSHAVANHWWLRCLAAIASIASRTRPHCGPGCWGESNHGLATATWLVEKLGVHPGWLLQGAPREGRPWFSCQESV